MERPRRTKGYLIFGLLALALIGWLIARYSARRQLLLSLGSNDMAVRKAAAAKLLVTRKLEDSLSALPIIRRSKTAEALGEIGSEEAMRVLGVILRDQEEAPRRWAAQALVRQGERAVPVLMGALSVGGATRDEAVAALRRIGEGAVPRIRFLLSDLGAQQGAAEALVGMGELGIEALVRGCYVDDGDMRARALNNMGLERVAAVMVPALDNLKPGGKISNAIGALGLLGYRSGVPAIIPFLQDAGKRTAAATALGQIGDPRAVEPILATMLVTEKGYRNAAILALRRIGAPAAPALVRELRSPEVLMRRGAAAGLVGSPAPGIVEELAAATRDTDPEVRASAARALGRKGDTSGVATLTRVLNDLDWRVVDAAAEALSEIGVSAVAHLVGVLADPAQSPTVRYHVARAMAEMGPPAVPELIAALSRPEPEVQKWSAVALGEIGDPRAVAPLEKLEAAATGDLKWVVKEQLRLLSRLASS